MALSLDIPDRVLFVPCDDGDWLGDLRGFIRSGAPAHVSDLGPDELCGRIRMDLCILCKDVALWQSMLWRFLG